jgi:hypothetical protein
MARTASLKALFLDTARALTGSARRRFLARTVKARGPGGHRRAARARGWSRGTIRQGPPALDRGCTGLEAFAARGRQPVAAHWPTVLRDLTALGDSQSQTEPPLRTTRLSPRLRAAAVRRPRIAPPGYAAAALPPVQPLTTQLHALGDSPKKVATSQPQKQSPQPTPSSLRAPLHHLAEQADDVLRISMDATALVTVGPCARGGKSRVPVAATDHAFQPEATGTPVGILRPTSDELFVSGITSKVTSDGLVDRLVQWWETGRERLAHIPTLVMHLDHGPAQHRRRTQCRQRLVEVGHRDHIRVRLASSPPYQSKDQPIERGWGLHENHWHGALLDSVEALLAFPRTMPWHGVHPVVELVTTTYQTGVKLTKEALDRVEAQLQRFPHWEKWFVDIPSPPPTCWDT